MIRKPFWVQDGLKQAARDILNDASTITDAADELADKVIVDDRPLTTLIVAERVRAWIKQELARLVRAATKIAGDEAESGQLALMPLPFPWLPAYLEVAPGRTVHQRVMTLADLDRARAIWLNRRDQAEISYQGFMRAYELVSPLLTGTATIGDVADQLHLDYGDGEAAADES
jgi:hypothetical protein